MNFRSTDPAGDDLHRLLAGAVSANVGEISSARNHHLVPREKHFPGKRFSKGAMKIDHHLGDALFGRAGAELVCSEPKLPLDRGLHAFAIEHLALDLRS